MGPQRTLFFIEEGQGRPLVLIHGALTTHADWDPGLRVEFARAWRVITLDRPGHGRSARPRFAGAPRDQAEQIRRGLGLEHPALVIAHSFGAMTALAWASLYPKEVAGLVLVAPIALPELRPIEHVYLAPRAMPVAGVFLSETARATTDEGFLDFAAAMMFSPDRPAPEWRKRIERSRILSAEALIAEGEDAAAIAPWSPSAHLNLTAVECPMHVICGDGDLIVRHERQGLALAALKRARLTRLAGKGHMAHICAPEALKAAVAVIARDIEMATPA